MTADASDRGFQGRSLQSVREEALEFQETRKKKAAWNADVYGNACRSVFESSMLGRPQGD